MRHSDYTYTTESNPHAQRSREILKKYPEVRKLIGNYPLSALYISLIVLAQIALAAYFSTANISWWWVLAVAYTVGAFAQHAMFAMVHESCHDMIFKTRFWNKVWGIICNIPQAFPSSMGFRTYHVLHHAHMSEYDYDADLASHKEAKWVGNSSLRKALWFVGFLLVESIRPNRLKKGKVFDTWTLVNIIVILATDYLIWHFFGFKALGYLLISAFFSVGLHPLGARWIQEHYIYKKGQETYSYYGILNKLQFNIGFHNEHHDLLKVPWINLPKLKALAPEYYDNLYSHNSWTKLILDFIFNPERDLYCRLVRTKEHNSKEFQPESGIPITQESNEVGINASNLSPEGV